MTELLVFVGCVAFIGVIALGVAIGKSVLEMEKDE